MAEGGSSSTTVEINVVEASAPRDKIEHELEAVKSEIESVYSQLKSATDESHKQYLRRKEEQLRRKEELLRRKEELLLQAEVQDKDLLILQKKRKLDKPQEGDKLPKWTKFWKELCNASIVPLNDDNNFQVLQLKQPCPVVKSTSFLVRPSYVKLYDCIQSKNHTLVTGNPGIGKTVFSIYVMYRIKTANSEACVAFRSFLQPYVVYMCGEMVEFVEPTEIDPGNAYYLIDCGTRRVMDGSDITLARECSKTVVFSSPARVNYADYEKTVLHEARGQRVYMPTWNWNEISKWNKHQQFLDPTVLQKQFYLCGGIPRYVFSGINMKTDLDRAIYSFKTISALSSVWLDRCGHSVDSHKVVQIIPTEDYSDYSVDFVSSYTRLTYCEMVIENDLQAAYRLVNICSPILATLQGRVFESIAHRQLTKGGEFARRNLSTGEEDTLTLHSRTVHQFHDLIEVREMDLYCIPLSENFESVDSFIPAERLFFQVTISPRHPIKVAGLKRIKKALSCRWWSKIHFYFVVPNKIFRQFKLQTVNSNEVTFPQYVITVNTDVGEVV